MSRRIRPVILSAAQELFLRALTLLMQHRALSRVVTAEANPARSRGGRSAFLRCPFRGRRARTSWAISWPRLPRQRQRAIHGLYDSRFDTCLRKLRNDAIVENLPHLLRLTKDSA